MSVAKKYGIHFSKHVLNVVVPLHRISDNVSNLRRKKTLLLYKLSGSEKLCSASNTQILSGKFWCMKMHSPSQQTLNIYSKLIQC